MTDLIALEAVWANTTAPYWTLIALCYGMASVWQRAFSPNDYPWWAWGSLLGVSVVLLLTVNRNFLFGPGSPMITTVEYLAMLAAIGIGAVMVYTFHQYAKERTVRKRIENALKDHGIDPEDIDIETPD